MSDSSKEKPIHVLTLTPFYPYEENEADGPFVAEPLEHLSKLQITHTVIAAKPLSHRLIRPTEGFLKPIWVRHLQLPGKAAYGSWGLFMYVRLARMVARLHRNHKIDIIHAHAALPCGEAALFLSRQLRIPFVVTTHGVDVLSTGRESGLARWWCEKSSRLVYRRTNRNICVSELSRRRLINAMGNSIEANVVYNGVDTDIFSPSNKIDAPSTLTILSVGRLDAIKGQNKVLRAMAGLVAKFPSLRCEIIGEGTERDRLMALTRELGIDQRVDMLGVRSRREVAEAMRRCTVFALPSREEALGCVFLEAMATTKPVIACQGEGIAEIIRHGENGWLVEQNNPQQLIESLSILLEDAELRNRLGQEGRKTIVEGLTLAHQAERLNRVYRECLKNKVCED